MTIRMIAFATAVLSVSTWAALAQQAQMQHPSGGQMAMSAESLPEECRTAAQAGGQAQICRAWTCKACRRTCRA